MPNINSNSSNSNKRNQWKLNEYNGFLILLRWLEYNAYIINIIDWHTYKCTWQRSNLRLHHSIRSLRTRDTQSKRAFPAPVHMMSVCMYEGYVQKTRLKCIYARITCQRVVYNIPSRWNRIHQPEWRTSEKIPTIPYFFVIKIILKRWKLSLKCECFIRCCWCFLCVRFFPYFYSSSPLI